MELGIRQSISGHKVASGGVAQAIGIEQQTTGHKVASGGLAQAIGIEHRISGFRRLATRIGAAARALIPTEADKIHPHSSPTTQPLVAVETLTVGAILFAVAVAGLRRALRHT